MSACAKFGTTGLFTFTLAWPRLSLPFLGGESAAGIPRITPAKFGGSDFRLSWRRIAMIFLPALAARILRNSPFAGPDKFTRTGWREFYWFYRFPVGVNLR